MKFQLLLLLIFAGGPLVVSAQEGTFTIDGKLEKIKKGTMILNIYEGDKTFRDSAPVKDGEFHFRGRIAAPHFATLTMADKRNDFFSFYVEQGAIQLLGRADSLQLLSVKGSSVNDDDKLLKERMKYITAWQERNSKLYEQAYKGKNRAVMDSLDEVDFDVLAEKRKVVAAFVKENPVSMRAAMAITENFGYYAEASEVQPLYDILSPEVCNLKKERK